MTKAQNIKFLIGLGIPKERAEKMSIGIADTAVETPAAELEEVDEVIRTHQSELYTNSDEYKTLQKSIKDKALAEAYQKAEKKIVNIFGLTAEEAKDKKYDELVELAKTKAASNKDKTTEEVQKELTRVSDELKTAMEVTIPSIRAEVDQAKSVFLLDNSFAKTLSSKEFPLLDGFELNDVIESIKRKAESKGFKVSVDDKGELEITNADGSKITTADRKGFMSPKEILKDIANPFLKKSKAGEEDTEHHEITIDEKQKEDFKKLGTAVSSGVAKALKHAEDQKKQIKK